ncbi:protein of unknown function [Paraburkholderia dioscoreae]|uniref:Uncharacterized protein n=1 Tax=Paraburkholderia dioscoreae TaxID=2604047 RepID=A0A5Q4ZPI6_9BURK|nr:protein of unknown function [Paraburkholderia dioscoreae]
MTHTYRACRQCADQVQSVAMLFAGGRHVSLNWTEKLSIKLRLTLLLFGTFAHIAYETGGLSVGIRRGPSSNRKRFTRFRNALRSA